jgi:hypothetical protein
MHTNISGIFISTYEASLERFRQNLPNVQLRWPKAELHQHDLAEHPDLSIDWLRADAKVKQDKLVILTTGQHGAEGFVGAAMLQLFIEEYLPRLNPDNAGLLLVHALNPWGMKHGRRVNANNVDLNRNFVWDEVDLNAAANPNYRLINNFLNPSNRLRNLPLAVIDFFLNLIMKMISPGESVLRSAMLMGQYAYPEGLYFGGEQWQEETLIMIGLYREMIANYDQILHLDMHTGYGPRYQMSLVNSPLESRAGRALQELFGYPLVVAATPDEFYSIHGDMVDWFYTLAEKEFPDKHLYSTAFEFGTYGDSLNASIRSMRTMINENRLHWHGAASKSIQQQVKRDFGALFSPHEDAWREKALADARQAFNGILRSEGYW